ncbi:Xylose isomerase-like TIM barrel [Stieleria neptunia]|uniref:Xylose isomerase-like TIM barrel n=2 Tax=Stieleria neptunia TaxID=2527979 RepID=A0A518I3X6_9BACT|nr:Xylose isomerase-like TIM barrel [Stieleria neptunia]
MLCMPDVTHSVTYTSQRLHSRIHIMHRRTVLKSAAAASVALATQSLPNKAAAGQFTGKIKKAIKLHMATGNESVLEKFRMIRDIGFDGVEPRVKLGKENEALVRSYAQASEATGLPIHGVVHSSNPDLVGAIDQAKMLGASSVLHVVRYDRKISYLQNYEETKQIIRQAVGHAEKQGVMILCENVWASYLIEPMGMARFIDSFDSPMVGIYFDVGNVVRWGWPQHWLEVIGRRAKKLDIKEYDLTVAMNEGMREGFRKPLGEGSIEWAKVRAELAKIDYHGWATAEVKGGDRKRLVEIAEQMDRVLDLV